MSETKRSRPGSLLAKLSLSLVTTILLGSAIEFSAGFFVPSLETISRGRGSEADSVSTTLAWLWINPSPLREDPNFLWRNQPFAKRTQLINPQPYESKTSWTVENNSVGFRGTEVRSDPAARNAYRILCIGDSITFGFNTDQDDSYPAQLDRVLSANFPEKDIEVINAGVPGWTWLQGLRFLERRGLSLEPDLVLMAHGTNDQLLLSLVTDAENLERADDPAVFAFAKLRSLVGNTNIYLVLEQLLDPQTAPVAHSPGCQRQIQDHGVCRRVSPQQIEAAVTRVSQLTESRGIDLIVLNLDFMKTPAAATVRKAAEAAGVTLIDLVSQLDSERALRLRRRSKELGLMPAQDESSDPVVPQLERKRQVVFRVMTPDSAASYTARGRAIYFRSTFEFNAPLNDDGRDGDEEPGDGVFSGTILAPRGARVFRYLFYRGDDPEFESLPPMNSTFGDREVEANDIHTTPVFLFADRFGMAEKAHPNAEGHRMVAESVASEISSRSSFQPSPNLESIEERSAPSGAPNRTTETPD
jgi:lysophospholipase L1-like esterase